MKLWTVQPQEVISIIEKQVNSSVMRLNPTRIFAKHMSG